MDTLIIEMLAVASASIVPWSLATVVNLKHLDRGSPYSVPVQFILQLTQSMPIILLILYIALNQPSRLMSIGFFWPIPMEDIGVLNSVTGVLLGGVVIHSFIVLPFSLYFAFTRKVLKKETDFSKPAKAWFSKYRTPWERCGLLTVLLLSAIAEELVFRGYLVLLLSERTGALFLCAGVSVILFAAIHLQYGPSKIPYYVWYAISITWLTVSSRNVVWAIAVHWGGNVTSAFMSWVSPDEKPQQHSSPALDDRPSEQA